MLISFCHLVDLLILRLDLLSPLIIFYVGDACQVGDAGRTAFLVKIVSKYSFLPSFVKPFTLQ